MIKQIISSALILCVSTTVLASSDDEFNYSTLPKKDSGITFISNDKMPFPETIKKENALHLQQQKTRGYSDSESDEPRQLIRSSLSKDEFNDNADPYDTHIKHKLSQIKLAFPFKEINIIQNKDIIGFSVRGAYIKDAGWTGVTESFKDKDLGVCQYSIDNMHLSHGGIAFSKETAKYDVNNKPGDSYVEGNVNSGFMYNLNWFDKTYAHFLSCANMLYDKDIMSKMVSLANKIDKE